MTDFIAPDKLRLFVSDCYQAMGVDALAAARVADTLVQADLWGHQSHGVMRLFWYAARIKSGAMNANAQPEIDGGFGAIATMNGHAGMGQVIAHAAMTQAIASAKEHGLGAVAVRNSGHFGTAMYFTRMAAQAGCLGFISTNASPAMAPWGGIKKRVGNNPWSCAAPAGRYAPMMLDIANTAVARGKLYLAKQRGQTVPDTWAIDQDGNATTDPATGIAGTLLPIAGHKGYAISTMMDVLSGILSGSRFGSTITGPYVPEGSSGVGHLVMAVDIKACRPLDAFNADMETLIADLKATPRKPGVDEIFYPGELEARADIEQNKTGISLPQDTKATLRAQAKEIGVLAPF